jgi:site-specific DNA recombinase
MINGNENKVINYLQELDIFKDVSSIQKNTVGESGSITSQKEIIKQYCQTNLLEIFEYYQDDGYTGTNFNRPDFLRMMDDAEQGKIACIITKDLSRLGRDYIMTGYYTEVYFPERNIRYIAIGDGFDTLNGNSSSNDIAPFKNLLNEILAYRMVNEKIQNISSHAIR